MTDSIFIAIGIGLIRVGRPKGIWTPVLVLSFVAIVAFFVVVHAFTTDSYFVCTEGFYSRDSPGGECTDGYTVPVGPPFVERVENALIPGVLATICGYVAVKTWTERNRGRKKERTDDLG